MGLTALCRLASTRTGSSRLSRRRLLRDKGTELKLGSPVQATMVPHTVPQHAAKAQFHWPLPPSTRGTPERRTVGVNRILWTCIKYKSSPPAPAPSPKSHSAWSSCVLAFLRYFLYLID